MNKQTAHLLEQHFDTAFSAPNGIKKLRELSLTLAMQGKLVTQEPSDAPARQLLKHYSLQAIIAVGFKIENERAVQFRKWANQIVKDYTIQGWVMDAERLKSGGSVLTDEFFERQLEKVRKIRASERKFYQKIADIYATSLDYETSGSQQHLAEEYRI